MKRHVKLYEEFSTDVSESLIPWFKKLGDKTLEFGKSVWDASKREKKETVQALHIVQKMVKGEDVSDNEKKFLKAQSIDIVKILPLIAIQGIPVPIPITPLLVVLGKRYGIDILPNSHTKINIDNE